MGTNNQDSDRGGWSCRRGPKGMRRRKFYQLEIKSELEAGKEKKKSLI